MEIPIKMDDLGGTPIFGNTRIVQTSSFWCTGMLDSFPDKMAQTFSSWIVGLTFFQRSYWNRHEGRWKLCSDKHLPDGGAVQKNVKKSG